MNGYIMAVEEGEMGVFGPNPGADTQSQCPVFSKKVRRKNAVTSGLQEIRWPKESKIWYAAKRRRNYTVYLSDVITSK